MRALFSVFLCLILTACGGGDEAPVGDTFDKGVLHVSCDESFRPVIDEQVKVYEAKYPDTRIIVHYKPEADCLRDFAVDSIRMVIVTRRFSEAERRFMIDSASVAPVADKLAYDALAVIVHPSNRDSLFTMDEIRGIVSGSLKKDLIPVFDGLRATSTVRFMLDSVLRGAPLGPSVVAARNSAEVIEYVARTPKAVGFLGVSWIGNREDRQQRSWLSRVRVAYLESTDNPGGFVQPSQFNIYTKRYPMMRDLQCIVKEPFTGLAHGFSYYMRNEPGQLVFRRAYLLPATRPYYVRDAETREE